MEDALKTKLKGMKVSDRGLAAMEIDGINDEAALKAKVCELGSVAEIQKVWTISKKAAANLIGAYYEAPEAPCSDDEAAFFAPLVDKSGLELGAILAGMASYGDAEDLVDMLTSRIIGKDELIANLAGGDDALQAKIELGYLKMMKNAPAPEAAPAPSAPVDPKRELGENETPSKDQIHGFAGMLGADPMTMMMLMNGMGGDLDIGGLIPVAPMVQGYNPKRRDLYLMVMGQLERHLGVPIVVIDADGSINRALTIQYIEALEEGFDPAENNVYFDEDATPHEVIRVGVDAQSIYDSDPLDPTRAIPKNGVGIGRVRWSGVPLEVRQVVYYAVKETGEIDAKSDADQSWLRDHIKKTSNRLTLAGKAPRALALFNEASRTGSLPTLKVMLSRSPRRPEIFPRRRRGQPRDLSGMPSPRRSADRENF